LTRPGFSVLNHTTGTPLSPGDFHGLFTVLGTTLSNG
jgi:hypothetical protein